MSTLTAIRSIAVAVADQDAALRFYTHTLGFDVQFDGDTPAGRWIMLALPGAATTLALVAHGRGTDTGIRFGTADAAAARTRLAGQGVVVSELITWEGMPPMFSFDDPDSNRFYVIEDAQ